MNLTTRIAVNGAPRCSPARLHGARSAALPTAKKRVAPRKFVAVLIICTVSFSGDSSIAMASRRKYCTKSLL